MSQYNSTEVKEDDMRAVMMVTWKPGHEGDDDDGNCDDGGGDVKVTSLLTQLTRPYSLVHYLDAMTTFLTQPSTYTIAVAYIYNYSRMHSHLWSVHMVTCAHSYNQALTAFSTHSTGLKLKGDGNHFPHINGDQSFIDGC